MKTPHAILIGLSLIAAVIFFKDTVVKPAHALGGPRGLAGFSCSASRSAEVCYMVDQNLKVYVWLDRKWKKYIW